MNKLLLSLFVSGAFFTTQAFAAEANGAFSPTQTQAIEKIVHDYLIKNPQVLVEVSQALQQQQMSQMQKTASKAIAQNAKQLFSDPQSPVIGNPNGDVTIVEFMDFQCTHCKEMSPIMETIIKQDGNVRVVYKELPIFGPTSEFAAKAALASIKQGKYAQFHAALMKDDKSLSKEEVLKIAQAVGLNISQLQKDADSPAIAQQLKDNFKLAQAMGLMGTPALVVANRDGSKTVFVPGTTSQQNLQQLIASMRK